MLVRLHHAIQLRIDNYAESRELSLCHLFVISGNVSCHNGNIQCLQSRQSTHYDNSDGFPSTVNKLDFSCMCDGL